MNKWATFAILIIVLYVIAGIGSKLFNITDYEEKNLSHTNRRSNIHGEKQYWNIWGTDI